MGRTNPTFRDRLTALESEWADYRRALRRRDRTHFDRLFEHARAHADACGYLDHDDPVVAVLLSVALAQEARVSALDDRTRALAERVERLERAVEGVEPPRSAPPAGQTALDGDWGDRDRSTDDRPRTDR